MKVYFFRLDGKTITGIILSAWIDSAGHCISRVLDIGTSEQYVVSYMDMIPYELKGWHPIIPISNSIRIEI